MQQTAGSFHFYLLAHNFILPTCNKTLITSVLGSVEDLIISDNIHDVQQTVSYCLIPHSILRHTKSSISTCG